MMEMRKEMAQARQDDPNLSREEMMKKMKAWFAGHFPELGEKWADHSDDCEECANNPKKGMMDRFDRADGHKNDDDKADEPDDDDEDDDEDDD
jgi:hypothetical protein